MKTLLSIRAGRGRFSDRVRPVLVFGASLLLGGCVVHDNQNKPEPSWWPNFLLRPDTVKPSGGKVNVNVDPKGWPEGLVGGGDPHVSADDNRPADVGQGGGGGRADAANAPEPVTPVWSDPGTFYDASAWYRPPAYQQLNGGARAPAPFPQQNTPTLYPDRGQAASESGSPTLYPPSGRFQTAPQHDVTVYPRGPVGPRGYRGQ